MKEITLFQCEICSKLHDTKEEAAECESKGKEYPLVKLNDTVTYRDDWNGGFGAMFHDLQIIGIQDMDHKVTYELGVFDEDAEYTYHETYIYGNEDFIDKCKII